MGILRLLLALCVVISHTGPIWGFQMTGGSLAVQSFFMISGFYMSLILNEKYIGENNSFKLFISNRLLRIYPIYLTVLVLSVLSCIVIGSTMPNHSFPVLNLYAYAMPDGISYMFLVIANIFIWGQDIVMFMGLNLYTGSLFFTSNFWNTSPALYNFLFIPQGWSLALEMTFYLVAPFLVRRKTSIILTVIMLSIFVRIIIFYSLNLQNDPWTYRFFPNEIMFFLTGTISYKIYRRFISCKIPNYAGLTMQLLIISITVGFAFLPQYPIQIFHFQVRDICYLLLIMSIMPFLFIYSKSSKWDYRIGELSYSIYVIHLLIARILGVYGPAYLQNSVSIAIISVIVSYGLTQLITRPIEKYRQKRLKRTI